MKRNMKWAGALAILVVASFLMGAATQKPKPIKRVGMVVGIKPEKIEEYKRLHADSNAGVRDLLNKYHMPTSRSSYSRSRASGTSSVTTNTRAMISTPTWPPWPRSRETSSGSRSATRYKSRCRARRAGPRWNGCTTTRNVLSKLDECFERTRKNGCI